MNDLDRGSRGAELLQRRRAGVLLHPTALSGAAAPEPRGALGAPARAFVDWLARAGFSVWQMLPLGPTVGSPYWARSDYAGETSLLDRGELPDLRGERADYDRFREANVGWLDDYVQFESLAQRFNRPWWEWPVAFRDRRSDAIASFAREAAAELEGRRIEQWYFDWQWRQLRRYAHERGVLLFGDLPIYVAPDSATTWSHRVQFQLGEDGQATRVAGVPPDYFSANGQLWGNPLYDWDQAQRDHFEFWRARFAFQLRRFDLVRIDHFRGLASYWSVPRGAATARDGHWYPAPGRALFEALSSDAPELPIVAEDLGLITPDVIELRTAFHLPGMRVLQFAFDGDADNPHLPHNYTRDLVAYTGTHDNDTTVGWYRSLQPTQAQRVQQYLRADAESVSVADCMTRACLGSVAQLAVLPAQDLLQLGSEARFNTPGTVDGNWSWRLPAGRLTDALAERYLSLNQLFGRRVARQEQMLDDEHGSTQHSEDPALAHS
jgi:4-alpha-glucanotransferase